MRKRSPLTRKLIEAEDTRSERLERERVKRAEARAARDAAKEAAGKVRLRPVKRKLLRVWQ